MLISKEETVHLHCYMNFQSLNSNGLIVISKWPPSGEMGGGCLIGVGRLIKVGGPRIFSIIGLISEHGVTI